MATLVQPLLPIPHPPSALPDGGVDPVGQAIFQEQVKEFIKHPNKLEGNSKSLWGHMWGQSGDAN